ncbi:MAG: CoA transferase [Pseudomonadales bacterium]
MTDNLPLRGLRVIEFCWVWSGPMIGQHLADLGADVIKVEWYKRYDLYRMRGVERLRGQMPESIRRESSYAFQSLNRNKRGLAADLKRSEGLQVVKDLIAESDILLENFTVGTLDRLGLTAGELNKLNEQLVVISLSATGRGSSIESLRSYGLMLSALGGFENLITDESGDFVGSPTFVMSDPNAALFGLLAALAGTLHARENSAGATYECSQVEAVASLVNTPARESSETAAIKGIFATAQGDYVAVEAPASAELVPDAFTDWAQQTDTEILLTTVHRNGGIATRVEPLGSTERSETFQLTEVRQSMDHPVSGVHALIATPWRIDGERPPIRQPAPRIGEHTDTILREVLGYSEVDIAALRDAGVTSEL